MARNNKEERLEKEKVIEVTKIAYEATLTDSYEFTEPTESRLQRKSDEDICNTPKRERHFEDQNLNIRRSHRTRNQWNWRPEYCQNSQKSKNELVKSLSMEFEQRLASFTFHPKFKAQPITPAAWAQFDVWQRNYHQWANWIWTKTEKGLE